MPRHDTPGSMDVNRIDCTAGRGKIGGSSTAKYNCDFMDFATGNKMVIEGITRIELGKGTIGTFNNNNDRQAVFYSTSAGFPEFEMQLNNGTKCHFSKNGHSRGIEAKCSL